MKRKIVLLFGIPGSGKGTQSVLLSEKYNLGIISTGAILRDLIKNNGDEETSNVMQSGALVNDDFVVSLIKNALMTVSQFHVLLDGFPRNIIQAECLEKILSEITGMCVSSVIYIKTRQDLALTRIDNRLICDGCGAVFGRLLDGVEVGDLCPACASYNLSCRIDDNITSVKRRLVDSAAHIEVLLEYYKKKKESMVICVDGGMSVDDVNGAICAALDDVFIV